MTTYGSDEVGFFLLGGFDLLGVSTELSDLSEALVEDTTTLGVGWDLAENTGGKRWEIEQTGFFNDATGSVHDALVAAHGVARVGALAYAGNVLARPFVGLAGVLEATYRRVAKRNERTKANGTYRGSGAH